MPENQKIVVTGSQGFVGKETCKLLEKKGFKVFHYDLLFGYDICDRASLLDVFKPDDPKEIVKVLHLAAVSRFTSANIHPTRAGQVNVGGTLNVLLAAEESGVERVVYSSTGSIYMPIKAVPITEKHEIRGNSPYGWTKRFADELCQEFMGRINTVILRYAHLYGKDKDRGGIYEFVSKLSRGLKPRMYGGNQSNDFCYVKDVAEANCLALQTENINQAYNIGTGEEIRIRECYNTIKKVLNVNIEPIMEEARVVDQRRFVFDISKARKMLGFNPKFNLKQGLEDMLNER